MFASDRGYTLNEIQILAIIFHNRTLTSHSEKTAK